MFKRLVFSILIMISLSACEFTKTIIPVETTTLPATPSPMLEMPSSAPGETTEAPVLLIPTQAPLPTVAPAGADSSCRPGDVLAGIRKDFPYEHEGKKALNAANYFFYQDLSAIVVWFQDESLSIETEKPDVTKTAEGARAHASQVTADLLKRDACIKQLFSALDVIVVDRDGNGWFSGELMLQEAPSAEDVQAISDAFEDVYLRKKMPEPLSAETKCTFVEARNKIKSHFSDGKLANANLEFYIIVDEGLGTVYAQWTGDATPANNLTRILNVAYELQCLTSPKIESIFFTVVDRQGKILAAGKMPGEAIATLDDTKIEYQEVQ
jgi:hypothetical protein